MIALQQVVCSKLKFPIFSALGQWEKYRTKQTKETLGKGKSKTKPLAKGCALPPLRKGNTNVTPLAKGKAKANAKRKGSPLKKEKGGKKDKNALNKDNLEKLGEMPLKGKIAKASEEESEEQGALVLQESLSAPEKSRAWSKHQTQQ